MDWMDSIGELFTDCTQCRGSGCELCGGHGVILSEAGRQAQRLGDDMLNELPRVSREEAEAAVKRLRAADRGIRLITKDGEHVPDINRKTRR